MSMDNENTALYKETLFDKIFKPQVITLENGHTVRRPRSRTPLIVICLALAIVWALKMTGFDLAVIVSRFSKMLDLLKKIFHPNWEFFPKVVSPLLDTIKMSILGTVIGCAIAMPVAILASSNINRNAVIVSVFRFILALIRTLPTLVIALVCAHGNHHHGQIHLRAQKADQIQAVSIRQIQLRHGCHRHFHLRRRVQDAVREHRDHRYGAFRGHGGAGRQ